MLVTGAYRAYCCAASSISADSATRTSWPRYRRGLPRKGCAWPALTTAHGHQHRSLGYPCSCVGSGTARVDDFLDPCPSWAPSFTRGPSTQVCWCWWCSHTALICRYRLSFACSAAKEPTPGAAVARVIPWRREAGWLLPRPLVAIEIAVMVVASFDASHPLP